MSPKLPKYFFRSSYLETNSRAMEGKYSIYNSIYLLYGPIIVNILLLHGK